MKNSFVYSLVMILATVSIATRVSAATVCTAALNSTEEIEVFKKHLAPQGFQFVELTQFAKKAGDEKWFDRACEAKVQCDVLIVSGHFGGHFFGSSGLELPLEKMEEHRCASSCDGILKKPRAVYLFGCNTLAGKLKDSRTPDEYRQALLRDAIPEYAADQIVAARYSPLGTSFNEGMRQVFAGVPHLYGFNSIAPTGKHVEADVDDYLKQVGDFSSRLRSENPGQDAAWSRALSTTNATLDAGFASPDAVQCQLQDPTTSTAEKITAASHLLASPESGKYLLLTGAFLTSLKHKELSPDDARSFQTLLRDSSAKKQTLAVYPYFKDSPGVRSDLIRVLSLWPTDPAAQKVLMSSLQESTNITSQLSAAFAMRGDVPPNMKIQFIEMLGSGDFNQQYPAIIALKGDMSLEVQTALVKVIAAPNSSPGLRDVASRNLQGTQDKSVRKALSRLEHSRDRSVSLAAATALQRPPRD